MSSNEKSPAKKYLVIFDMILAALFWIHCNLGRLNLYRLLKSELQ